MTDYGADLIWELIYFTLPTQEVTNSIFGPSGSRGNFKTMFISDGHVLLDILQIQPNYADRPAASIAHLRVIALARVGNPFNS